MRRQVAPGASKRPNNRDLRYVTQNLQQLARLAKGVLAELAEKLGRFIAVKLNSKTGLGAVKVGFTDRPENVVERGIDEDAKDLHLLGGVVVAKDLDDFRGPVGGDVARAFVVEIQPDRGGAGLGGEQGVVRVSDAADFNLEHRQNEFSRGFRG